MIKSMNIAWWVQRWGELQPNKPAVIFEGSKITYLELHERANRAACWLQSLEIEKGDRVALMLNNCPEFVDIYLACSRIGAIFVPINFRLEGPELEYTLGNCRPRIFIFGSNFFETVDRLRLNEEKPLMILACLGDQIEREGILDYNSGSTAFEGKNPFITNSIGPSDPEEPQVIMYTSGTTGQPKGAVLSHRKTFFNCLNADIFFKLHYDDIMLIVLPLYHSGGLFIQAAPVIYKGSTMIIHPRFEPVKVYQDIERYRVTKFLGVPTVFRLLLKVGPENRGDISSLKLCAGGGENSTQGLIKQCKEAGFGYRQIMGQTETSILLWASEEEALNKPGTVGRPVFHAEVNILDRQEKPVKPLEIGEIVVRGSIMMNEYWMDPSRTKETIKKGWLHTGDLARMDEEGYFYLMDRAKDMFISGGENIYPAEIEKVLKDHPKIEDIAVIGRPDEIWGEVGHAFVIVRPGADLDEKEIMEFCEGRLARYKWPKMISFRDEFPRTSLGKVRKVQLIKELEEREKRENNVTIERSSG
ncbi:class I adenylate-forming enzyme family protein [Thermodesulfobacteriota bacterium]